MTPLLDSVLKGFAAGLMPTPNPSFGNKNALTMHKTCFGQLFRRLYPHWSPVTLRMGILQMQPDHQMFLPLGLMQLQVSLLVTDVNPLVNQHATQLHSSGKKNEETTAKLSVL